MGVHTLIHFNMTYHYQFLKKKKEKEKVLQRFTCVSFSGLLLVVTYKNPAQYKTNLLANQIKLTNRIKHCWVICQ